MVTDVSLLSGTAIKTERGYYYVKNNVRVRIPSRKVAASWRFAKVVKADEESVAHLPVAGVMGFRDGTLLWCIADASYYIISNSRAVKVNDPTILKNHNLKFKDAYIVSKKERDLHKVTE